MERESDGTAIVSPANGARTATLWPSIETRSTTTVGRRPSVATLDGVTAAAPFSVANHRRPSRPTIATPCDPAVPSSLRTPSA